MDYSLEIYLGIILVKDTQTFLDVDYITNPRDRKSITSKIPLVLGGAVI